MMNTAIERSSVKPIEYGAQINDIKHDECMLDSEAGHGAFL